MQLLIYSTILASMFALLNTSFTDIYAQVSSFDDRGVLTGAPSRESRRADMRANTCCTVSLKGGTTLLRRSHSRMRCAHIQPHPIHSTSPSTNDPPVPCGDMGATARKPHAALHCEIVERSEHVRTSLVAWLFALVASPAMPVDSTGLAVSPAKPCTPAHLTTQDMARPPAANYRDAGSPYRAIAAARVQRAAAVATMRTFQLLQLGCSHSFQRDNIG